ncbi:hypothetical protein Q2T40_13230 [Winogradskyella maritima]|uniref:Uncharacterized protein n=1 Tax=Winogradskyella maritima TaxID=1517766 RepID=A0ABV8AHN5_9FLAO|nr:hypothetical protein [Winogradskyella maritima]
MAKLKSLIKIEGTLDDLTFYKTEDGYVVRQKGGVSKNRIQTDPAFVRTRENNSEFGASATSGKLLRQAIIPLLNDAKDPKVTSRLTRVMTQVKNEDTTSVRGQRNVASGITTANGKALLKGFEFNVRSTLSSVILADINLDEATGIFTIPNLKTAQRINPPDGATHVTFSSAFLKMDFATGEKELQLSNEVNLTLNNTQTDVTLTPTVPTASGVSLYFLKIAFFQELNGVQYPLNNGAYNTLKLMEVL